jgi:hypothetical protein
MHLEKRLSGWKILKIINKPSMLDEPPHVTPGFMDYDLGYFDLETRVLEPLENPFGPKVLPMS